MSQLRKAWGQEALKGPLDEETLKEAVEAYATHGLINAARELGISPSTMHQRIQKARESDT